MEPTNLFQDKPIEEREQHLRDNAYVVEKSIVRRPYTPEELIQFKEELSEHSIVVSEKEDELKELSAPIKSEIAELQEIIVGKRDELINAQVAKFKDEIVCIEE